MVIVDSCVWIDILKNRETTKTILFEELAADQELGLLDINLYEILQGIKPTEAFEKVRSRLMTFSVFDTGGADLAIKAAENSIKLRAHGVQTATADCLIASFCIENGHPLLTCDNDFKHYAEHLGLVLIQK